MRWQPINLWPWSRRLRVRVLVRGVVGRQLIRWEGTVTLPAGATLGDVLRRAGPACGADLRAAVQRQNPVLMVDGDRVEVPEGLGRAVADGAEVTWLMPMGGGAR